MKEYKYKVCLCDGHFCAGYVTVTAENEDDAYNMAIEHVCNKLYLALPELGIDVYLELED